ncbi:unnamed protein product, partial [Musa hybrid cultivar]
LCGRFSHPRRSRVISIFDRFHCVVRICFSSQHYHLTRNVMHGLSSQSRNNCLHDGQCQYQ